MSVTGKKINKRALILGYPTDLIDMKEALEFTQNRIDAAIGGHIVTLNPEMIMHAIKNPELGEVLKKAELAVPDGIGIVISLKKLGVNNIEQLPGIEFSYNLIQKCAEKGYKVGFLGASKDTVELMVQEFKIKFPELNIVFAHDGYFGSDNELEIIENLKNSGTQVLFVALGVPKQELWINKYRNELNSTVMVGVGGSFDVWAGKVQRAPYAFRKLGLEWFFRLISQPSRFRRMFPVLPLFFIKVWLDRQNTRKEN